MRNRAFSFVFCLVSILSLKGQEMAPKEYDFNWQKANGDQFAIAVENKLSQAVELKRLDRACMQILLKAMLKSRDFETFTPEVFILNEDVTHNVAQLDFRFLNRENEWEKRTVYYRFDYYGNVFNQLE